ncbi:MAG: hypothetical protein ACE5JN_15585 [Candidatus Methylomirabilia bacterium]
MIELGGVLTAGALFEWQRSQPRWAMARLCRTLAIALETSMPLERALDLAARATG